MLPSGNVVRHGLGGPLLQKMLGVWFMASVIVLSYVATIHLVSSRSIRTQEPRRTAVRQPEALLSGPVSLKPNTRKEAGVRLRYRPVVKKTPAARKARAKNWKHIPGKKVAAKRALKKRAKRSPASLKSK